MTGTPSTTSSDSRPPGAVDAVAHTSISPMTSGTAQPPATWVASERCREWGPRQIGLPAAGAPLGEMRALGPQGRVVPVAGVHHRLVTEPVEELRLDVV